MNHVEPNRNPPIFSLPPELFFNICLYLDSPAFFSLSRVLSTKFFQFYFFSLSALPQTCKFFHAFCSEETIKSKFEWHFLSSPVPNQVSFYEKKLFQVANKLGKLKIETAKHSHMAVEKTF